MTKLRLGIQSAKARLSSVRMAVPRASWASNLKGRLKQRMPRISNYLPNMPAIPLPSKIKGLKQKMDVYDSEYTHPLLVRLNQFIVPLSLACICSTTVREVLAFNPWFILHGKEETDVHIPRIWTFITCNFIEQSFWTLIFNLALINYTAHKNREVFSGLWTGRQLTMLLFLAGFLSTASQYFFRCFLLLITQDSEVYSDFYYGSLRIILMTLLMGLR